MNIALIISSLNSGGAERVLSELANYWVSKGLQVTLITFASPNIRPFYPLDSKIRLIQLDQSRNENSYLKRIRNILKRIFYLRKTIKSLKPNVIVSFIDIINLTTLLATINLKIPVIVSERTHSAFHKLPSLYKKLREYLYPKAFQVIVQTDTAADYFKEHNNVIVISNPVTNPLRKKEIVFKAVQQIVSVGRLCLFKGFDTLIKAFSRLHTQYPYLRLTIYGEGAERSNLESLIASLHLEEKIFLPGLTQNIQQVLLDADLFVFPSHYEGFPNALCEAMAVGLPIIASNCSGNIDIVRDGIDGRLFPIGNVEILAQIMQEMLNDYNQCKRLGKNAQEVCMRFHPDIIFKQWDDLIAQAIKV